MLQIVVTSPCYFTRVELVEVSAQLPSYKVLYEDVTFDTELAKYAWCPFASRVVCPSHSRLEPHIAK